MNRFHSGMLSMLTTKLSDRPAAQVERNVNVQMTHNLSNAGLGGGSLQRIDTPTQALWAIW